MENAVEKKSFVFAIRIVKLSKYLRETQKEYTRSTQLLRSGTSIGANIAEAQQEQSCAYFISKLNIALKEAVETNYWIRLLQATEYLTDSEYTSMISDCKELERLLTASLKTTRNSPNKTS